MGRLIKMGRYAKIQRVQAEASGNDTTTPPFLCKNLNAASPYRWGVVQPVGHRTVNADGEGSNPSAPAIHSVAVSPGLSTG